MQFGTVVSVAIITDRDTGQSKGFGFLGLATHQEAASAITKMNGSEMDGRTIKVSEAQAKAPRSGSGTGRRNHGGFRR